MLKTFKAITASFDTGSTTQEARSDPSRTEFSSSTESGSSAMLAARWEAMAITPSLCIVSTELARRHHPDPSRRELPRGTGRGRLTHRCCYLHQKYPRVQSRTHSRHRPHLPLEAQTALSPPRLRSSG